MYILFRNIHVSSKTENINILAENRNISVFANHNTAKGKF